MSWEAACSMYSEAEEKVLEKTGKKPVSDTWVADMIDSIVRDEWDSIADIASYIMDCMRGGL